MFMQLTAGIMGLFFTFMFCQFMKIATIWAHERRWITALDAIYLVVINALCTLGSWVILEMLVNR